jgi:broad specificity phosphatase PhoE
MTAHANRPALLVLVRHGQSARNVAKKRNRFYLDDEARRSVAGVPDHRIPLTEEGHRQALVTGEVLRREFGAFDVVFHSGYQRTVETTNSLLAAYTQDERNRIRVRHHLFIRERDAGHAYDMTDAEAMTAFPWLQDYWSTYGPFFARPAWWREPGAGLRTRVRLPSKVGANHGWSSRSRSDARRHALVLPIRSGRMDV